jgi:hypothetical protein
VYLCAGNKANEKQGNEGTKKVGNGRMMKERKKEGN